MGETAETLRNHHHASKKPGELSHLDPESYLKLPPMMTVKLRLSRLPFMPYKPLEKGLGSNTKDRRYAPRAS